jgi:hypothetical protein
MTEHDGEAHEAKADELERELDEMQDRTGRLGDDIEDAEEDWERKKKDSSVPGAGGEPEQADGPEPEAGYPGGKGGDADGEGLDFGKSIDSGDVVGEQEAPADGDRDEER